MNGIVVIGCGARKLSHAAPAAELYTGAYFAECLRTARKMADDDRVLILSARYGLLGVAEVIEPYDLGMGQPGAVRVADVRDQAAAHGILGDTVTALCGSIYAAVLREIWPDLRTPLAGLGIGYQRREMRLLRDRRH
jgi:hypothetical protein